MTLAKRREVENISDSYRIRIERSVRWKNGIGQGTRGNILEKKNNIFVNNIHFYCGL